MTKRPYVGQGFLHIFIFFLMGVLLILISLSFVSCVTVTDKLPTLQQRNEQQMKERQIQSLKERNHLVETCIKAHQLEEIILSDGLINPPELKEAMKECRNVGL